MNVPSELRYSRGHEWVRLQGEKAYIGITDYAQHAMGDIVFIELPELDSEVNAEDAVGVVESVKAASDLYSPAAGKIVEVNEDVADSPDKVNVDPYENWIFALELKDAGELDELMTAEQYEKFCEEEG